MDWKTILAQHDRWLRTILAARLREREAVEDVLQEVALAAVRQSSPIADKSKVAPWLYRLAVRQALLYRRGAGRRRKFTDRLAARTPLSSFEASADPLAWLLADERQALLREALARLCPRDVEILLLKYTDNWTYRQIANHLGISASAVESRLHRARARLRSELSVLEPSETTYQPDAQARASY
jgi:RNA polymerase sigma-70 factor (ECF subfamily)